MTLSFLLNKNYERFSFETQSKIKFLWPHIENKKVLENIPDGVDEDPGMLLVKGFGHIQHAISKLIIIRILSLIYDGGPLRKQLTTFSR